jgi:hypothetical protein
MGFFLVAKASITGTGSSCIPALREAGHRDAIQIRPELALKGLSFELEPATLISSFSPFEQDDHL